MIQNDLVTMAPAPVAAHHGRPSHDACVFILGCDRSGTTLVQKLLTSHSQLNITYESGYPMMVRHVHRPGNFEPALQAVAEFPQLGGIDLEGVRDDLRALDGANFADLVALLHRRVAALSSKPRWGDKVPAYTQHVLGLAMMFPAARFLHVVRDPRSIAVSWIPTNWGPNTYWHVGRCWADAVGVAMVDMEFLEPWRASTIRFEDLVREPEPTLQGVCKFLDLPWDPEMLSSERRRQAKLPSVPDEILHSKVDDNLDPKRAESWRRLDPKLFEHLEATCGDLMKLYGYELANARPELPTRSEEIRYRIANRLLSYWNDVRRFAAGIRSPKYKI